MPVISDLSLTITPSLALYTSLVADANITAQETSNEGRKSIVLDFFNGDGLYSRDIGTIFQWPVQARTVIHVWQPSLLPLPEGIYDRASDWDDGGYAGAKFIQGIIVEADSFNQSKTFYLQDSDTLTLHALNECPTTFNKQSVKAFSCTPFVAHSVRVISNDGVEWRVWSEKLVFQPWPELCLNWQTELHSVGGIGWQHAREMNIPLVSTATVNLILTFDQWPSQTLAIASTANAQIKNKVTLQANKFKLIGLQASSAQPFRLFAEDIELKVKTWGSADAYRIVKAFGGKSAIGAEV